MSDREEVIACNTEEAGAAVAEGEAGCHPYLSGIHRPMSEEYTLDRLTVSGELPVALNGRYLRIGPNPIDPDPARYHWFSGDGMIHGLWIENGCAKCYRNRWIRSSTVAPALGELPAAGPRHPRNDVVNTNIIELAGDTWALVEAGSYPVVLSEDLERQAYSTFSDTLLGSFSAHPHRDGQTGELHAIAYEGGVLDTVRHVVVSPAGLVTREEPIAVQHGPSIHDCAVTDNYVVVLDLPVTFSLDAAQKGRDFPFRWNEHHRAKVGLLPKTGGGSNIVWCDVDPCYVFHIGNAWEADDGTVVLDVIAYETMFDSDEQGAGGRCIGLERWTIDPWSQRVERSLIDANPQEFPRYDERRSGRPSRFLYSIATGEADKPLATRLYKYDLNAGTRIDHDFGKDRAPGEFVFVPAYADSAEDEGWLIGLVVDVQKDRTDLVILDAQAFAGPPVATVHLPHRVPPGFHGNWFPARR